MNKTKEKNIETYTFGRTPLVIIEQACKKKPKEQEARFFGQNLGKEITMGACDLYEFKIKIKEGKKANAHYCHGNYHNCDHIMGIALQLSDESSPLYKKVYGKK